MPVRSTLQLAFIAGWLCFISIAVTPISFPLFVPAITGTLAFCAMQILRSLPECVQKRPALGLIALIPMLYVAFLFSPYGSVFLAISHASVHNQQLFDFAVNYRSPTYLFFYVGLLSGILLCMPLTKHLTRLRAKFLLLFLGFIALVLEPFVVAIQKLNSSIFELFGFSSFVVFPFLTGVIITCFGVSLRYGVSRTTKTILEIILIAIILISIFRGIPYYFRNESDSIACIFSSPFISSSLLGCLCSFPCRSASSEI